MKPGDSTLKKQAIEQFKKPNIFYNARVQKFIVSKVNL